VWVSMCVRYAMFDGQVCPMGERKCVDGQLPMFDGQVCPVGERKCGYYLCLMGKCVLWVSVNVDITYV
jgi:hypothetical protein